MLSPLGDFRFLHVRPEKYIRYSPSLPFTYCICTYPCKYIQKNIRSYHAFKKRDSRTSLSLALSSKIRKRKMYKCQIRFKFFSCADTAISLHSHNDSLVQWTNCLLPAMRFLGSKPQGSAYVKLGFLLLELPRYIGDSDMIRSLGSSPFSRCFTRLRANNVYANLI